MKTLKNHNITTGTVIEYVHPKNGSLTRDQVIRIEGDCAIVSRLTIGSTWKELPVNFSYIVSYTNYLDRVL